MIRLFKSLFRKVAAGMVWAIVPLRFKVPFLAIIEPGFASLIVPPKVRVPVLLMVTVAFAKICKLVIAGTTELITGRLLFNGSSIYTSGQEVDGTWLSDQLPAVFKWFPVAPLR